MAEYTLTPEQAERERAVAERAWGEGAEYMAAQEGIAPDWERNPYLKATS